MSLQAAALYALVSVAGADKSVSDLKRVSGQVNATQGVMSGLARNAGQIGKGVGQVAGGLVRVGQYAAIAAAGAGVAAAKTAIDFQDAFATVEKTVEGTPEALNAIDQGLRKLSTTIPVTFKDLTAIASEAGALGVKTKDIESFTEAVARTSAATVGLDPFMASEAFGKLSTIFSLTGEHVDRTTGKMVSDYDRLGSALVALGNAGASSEAEIIDVSKYFAGAGQQAGLSAAQVLAWGSALTSLGMQPEAGGGALQRVFSRLTTNIGIGSSKVKEWAKVSGVSVKDFTKLFREDASGAVIKFLGGLKDLDKFQAAAALKDAGIINQRDIRAIITLSQHIPVLTDQLKISTDAWAENTALMAVSEKRFDTLKSKLTELHNTVLIGAAAVGDGMVPALGRLAAKAKDFVNLHMGDLENLGKDIGRAIDEVDWGKVNAGAMVAVDLAKTLLTIISKIPVEITAAAGGFMVLNKLSGGLLGAGLGNIAGGVAGIPVTLLRSALMRMPGLGQTIAAATALHVWVDNMPIGGFGGPGVGGAGAVGAASIWSKVGTIIGGAFAIVAVAAIADQIHSAISPYGGLEGRTNAGALLPADQLSWPFGPKNTPRWIIDSPFGQLNLLGGDSTFTATPGSGGVNDRGSSQGPQRLPVLRPVVVDSPRTTPTDLAGIEAALARGRAAGFHPKFEAGQATLQRDQLREAQRTTLAAASTRDAVDRLARSERSVPPPILNLSITVPAVKSYVQVVQQIARFGAIVPNSMRHGQTEVDR